MDTITTQIRLATESDVPAILAIYNDAVLHTTASWDYEPATLDQRVRWFELHRQQKLPVIVAESALGTVMGWGSLSKFREKIGYQFTVEHSVYVAAGYRRQGIGRTMLLALIDCARNLGMRVMVGGVDAANEPSIALHRALGFEQVAYFRRVGYKFERWLDLIFFQRELTE